MKKRILLPILFLLVSVLAGCNNNPVTSEPSDDPVNSETESTPESETHYTWSISNKEALTAPWRVKEDNRAIEIDCEPAINLIEHLDEDLFITSSNPTVVGVAGKYLQPLSVGTATVTVEFDGKTDSVELTVDEEAGEPAVVTGKTLAQVFADTEHADRGALYEIEGLEIKGYQSGKTDFSKYGNFVVNDGTMDADVLVYGATSDTDAFAWQGTAYKFTNPQNWQTNDATKGIEIGYTVKMRVARFYYNGTTPELEGIVLEAEAPAKVPAESISLDKQSAYIRVGGELTLKATQLPGGAADPVTWTSSDTTVATVAEGKVTALKAGTTTITAKISDTISATCAITVEDLEAEPTVVTTPVAGTQYKFGIKHDGLYAKNGNDWWYVTGAMDGFYAATTTDFTAAADVTVEETTGGYYLVATVEGAKKYIDVFENGDHINVEYKDAANAVYTINDKGHFVTKVAGEDYTIGTSASSTYNTLSPRKVSASSYVATLLDVSALTPSEPDVKVEPTLVTVSTLAEAINNPAAEMGQKFHIAGVTVSSWRYDDSTDGGEYGNFHITDGTTTILVYGATATSSALSWDETNGTYKYTNAKDFLTNELTKTIVIGSKVDLDFVVTSYKETKQLNAIITGVTNSTEPEATGLSFWKSGDLNTVTPENTPTDSVIVTYNGAGNTYAVVGAAVADLAKGNNTFTFTVKNTGTAAAKLRVDIQGTTKVGETDCTNVSATFNGTEITTDLVYGGSNTTIAAGAEGTFVVKYDGEGQYGSVTNVMFYLDSFTWDDSNTYSSSVTLSGFEFTNEKEPEPTPASKWGTKENPITIDQFLEAAKDLAEGKTETEVAYVKGLVSANDAFNTQYSNYGDKIHFYSDDKTNDRAIFAYRAKVDSALDLSAYTAADSLVGKVLTLECKAQNYYGTLQMTTGGKIIAIEDGVLPEKPSAETIVLRHNSSTTTNMTGGNDANKFFGLDDSIWTITSDKNGNNNHVGLNKDGSLRLYGNPTNILSISAKDITIASIKITFTGSSYSNVLVEVDGSAVTASNGVYEINGSSFVLKNGNSSTTQVRISSIEITLA